MTLIGETSIGRDGSNSLARPQQLPRPIKPTHKPEGVGRHAVTFCEHTSETLTAHSHSRGCLTYRLEIRRNWLCGIFRNFSHAQPMPAYHHGQFVPVNVAGLTPQALDFPHHRGNCIFTGGHIRVKANDAERFCQRSMRNTCWNADALTGSKVDGVAFDDEPTSSGKNKCNLVLAVEVRWQPNTAPMDGTKLHKSVFRWAPIIPSSARAPSGWHFLIEKKTFHHSLCLCAALRPSRNHFITQFKLSLWLSLRLNSRIRGNTSASTTITCSRSARTRHKVSEPQSGEAGMIGWSRSLGPSEFALLFGDAHVVDGGFASPHQTCVVELPLFIAIGAVPLT